MAGQKLEEHRIKKEVSHKKFGYQLSSIFIIITIIRFIIIREFLFLDFILLLISLILFLISKFKEKYIIPIKSFWLKFSIYLAKILNPIILSIIYLICFLPIGIIYKVIKKNRLKTKFDKKILTYWEEPEDQKINFDEQF